MKKWARLKWATFKSFKKPFYLCLLIILFTKDKNKLNASLNYCHIRASKQFLQTENNQVSTFFLKIFSDKKKMFYIEFQKLKWKRVDLEDVKKTRKSEYCVTCGFLITDYLDTLYIGLSLT